MGAPLTVSPESLLLLKLAKTVKEIKARQPEKGDAGRDPTADEIFTAVSLWMEFHRQEVRGEPGKSPKAIPGPAGTGIDDLDVEDGELVVTLTDGRTKRLKLPEIRDRRYNTMLLGASGSGGMSADEVQQLINAALEEALAGPMEVKNDTGDQLRADSGEVEYTPGPVPFLVTAAGLTTVYTAPADKAFRLRWANAIPVLRGVEEPPVISLQILDSSGGLVRTPYMGAAISKRQLITGPVGGKIAINLDIAARVPCSFIIEEFTP